MVNYSWEKQAVVRYIALLLLYRPRSAFEKCCRLLVPCGGESYPLAGAFGRVSAITSWFRGCVDEPLRKTTDLASDHMRPEQH